ncbi:preprotein translocase subunit SecE [Candidatus Kinetoplastibacterium blastocrithidii TCC012E]|uniref:Preprotein translocase subunit SecE n=1 Tax=Candidatus Kinetoplastidibacterium blastocrithidiae TCC012E TaxID=1208922 RepID=M1M543_9PROT|nr:preprotein translocase subunit SecE [Candidatus Kinetoplastibacterium blastocrithidii]AFZ83350.1 preprotein translocase subunit SecE [Candidatus Kinetoplastibacterium blastocrithidii (ex Strigomonas culicis)]AGF50169.1 preprotein translocase subunit SecE [Candidatus Kinetoplastibacterium blastocrithidii TCC012E]
MSISSFDNCFSRFDKVKFFLAFLVFFLGLVPIFWLSEKTMLFRLVCFSVFSCLSFILFIFNEISKSFFSFCRDSFFELKRVSWPDRKSAIRMTGTVCVFAILISIFICLIDKIIDFFIYGILLGWR